MRVTDITAEQLPALAGLYAVLSHLPEDVARMSGIFDRMAANPDYHLLGATLGEGRLVGTLLGVVCLDLVGPCRPFMVVENVVVAARYRRHGVGRRLFQEIERRARARDCFYLMLVSGPGREDARAFYSAQGYFESAGFKKRL
jgi:phosphoglycolate phosphatase